MSLPPAIMPSRPPVPSSSVTDEFRQCAARYPPLASPAMEEKTQDTIVRACQCAARYPPLTQDVIVRADAKATGSSGSPPRDTPLSPFMAASAAGHASSAMEENMQDIVRADGYLWLKYGQKNVHNSHTIRCYYKCYCSKNKPPCPAKKTVDYDRRLPISMSTTRTNYTNPPTTTPLL
ncbi:hypothetical protein CLOP_g17479 [Closterium sp. NIES-67]|nr:hypothetical protein CLOP_g17479 [Closterium sp. NIES-67]